LQMKSLKSLMLGSRTQVCDEQVQELRQALPDCKIHL